MEQNVPRQWYRKLSKSGGAVYMGYMYIAQHAVACPAL